MVKRVYDHLRPGGWVEYQVRRGSSHPVRILSIVFPKRKKRSIGTYLPRIGSGSGQRVGAPADIWARSRGRTHPQEFSLEAVGVDEATRDKLRGDHSAYQGWMDYMKDGSRRLGRDIDVTPKLGAWMREAGFVDVVEKRIMAPYV